MTTAEPTPEDIGRDLAADMALCAAAAPGPWRESAHGVTPDTPSHLCIPILAPGYDLPAHCYGRTYRNANAAFIAAAREGWPAALRRALAAEAEAAALRTQLAAAYDRVAAQSELLSRRAEVPARP